MNATWAVVLDRADAQAARFLRRWPIHGLFVGEQLWLCGSQLSADLESSLALVPATARFEVREQQLAPKSAHLTVGELPSGDWMPLSDLLPIAEGTLSMPSPSATCERVPLRLVRATSMPDATPSGLLATIENWQHFAATAPSVRLRPLAFAASSNGRVLIRGTPLPPIVGEKFMEEAGVFTPLGWEWCPCVPGRVVRSLYEIPETTALLATPDGKIDFIAAEDFVAATRSAARLLTSVVSDK